MSLKKHAKMRDIAQLPVLYRVGGINSIRRCSFEKNPGNQSAIKAFPVVGRYPGMIDDMDSLIRLLVSSLLDNQPFG